MRKRSVIKKGSKTKIQNATRLMKLREALGFSQREMAKEFGVTQGAIGLWERGERPITGPILKLMDIYEIRLSKEAKDTQ